MSIRVLTFYYLGFVVDLALILSALLGSDRYAGYPLLTPPRGVSRGGTAIPALALLCDVFTAFHQ